MQYESTSSKSRLEEMVNGAVNELIRLRYSSSTIRHRQEVWKRYMKWTAVQDLDFRDCRAFLEAKYGIADPGGKLSHYQRSAVRSMEILREYAREGEVRPWHYIPNSPAAIPEGFREAVEEFLWSMEQRGYAKQTREDYSRTLRRLTNFLKENGVTEISGLRTEHVSSFIVSVAIYHGSSIGALLSELRQFFRFLYLNGYHAEDRSLFIPRSNTLRTREHLPVFWTREDVEKVLSVIDVGNPIGKRDYAMILLVARLGLRVSDVKNLKFSDIKWEKNSIEINQYKTKEPLTLPLPEDVGNAIIDYLQNGRPQSDVQNIFIRHQPPFVEFNQYNRLHATFSNYVYKAGIDVSPDKSRGMHSLRHSLAVEMLRREVPLPVIQEVLGHKDPATTANYLRVDIEQLRNCALSPEVPHA